MIVLWCVLGVFAVALLLYVAFGPLVLLLDKQNTTRKQWLTAWAWALLWIGLVTGGIVTYVHGHPDHGANNCADRGGVWTRIGSHTVYTGKSAVNVHDYACIRAAQ